MLCKIFSTSLKNHLFGFDMSSNTLSYLPTGPGFSELMSKESKILDPGPNSCSRVKIKLLRQESKLGTKLNYNRAEWVRVVAIFDHEIT